MRPPALLPTPSRAALTRGLVSSSLLAAVALLAACDDYNPLTAPGAGGGTGRFAAGFAGLSVDTLKVGETTQLTTKLPARRGKTVATATTWTSSATAVATVSADGLVTGVAPGAATIRAANNLGADSVTVLVIGAAVAPPPAAPPAPDTSALRSPIVSSLADSMGTPQLPQAYVDTRMPAATGRTIAVAAGGDLQAALDAAQPGDVVALAPGATFVGNFVLRPKAGMAAGQWVTVRTSGALPAEGTRVGPGDAGQLPKLLTPNSMAALATAPGAQGWRLTGLEVGAAPQAPFVYALVALGSAGAEQATLAQVPSRIVLDRAYVHGSPTLTLRRCVALNSAASAVIDSYLDDCHEKGADSQAILGWNGPGPFKIVNNYLAGAGENVMFGGADPTIPNLVPADIEFRHNDVVKPAAWKGVWTAKNLFEIKNARRVLVDHNRFEGSWLDGQTGPGIVLKSHNQDGACNWCVGEHITFRNNRVRNVGAGFVVSGAETYNGGSVVPLNHVLISNNVLELMNTGIYQGANRAVQIGGVGAAVVFDHNTFATPGASQLMYAGTLGTGFRFTNNVAYHGQYGVMMDGNTWATATLDAMAPGGYVFAGNAVLGTDGAHYPAGNLFPASELAATALRAADGTPLGADASKIP